MIADAIDKIQELSKEVVHDIDGVKWLERNGMLYEVRKSVQRQGAIHISTLSGLLDFINIENPVFSFIHIESYRDVNVVSAAEHDDKKRTCFISAQSKQSGIDYDYMDIERFLIMLNTCFAESDPEKGDTVINDIAKVLSRVKEQKTVDFNDNGLSQNISIKNTLNAGDNISVELPNPIKLRPYRTFTEIEQPQVQYVLRLKRGHSGPTAALFESRSTQWQLEAIEKIKLWLSEKLPGPIIA